MIRKNIQLHFPHHLTNRNCITTSNAIYVADYTEKTKHDRIKRRTKLFDNSPPSDIEYYFTVNNPNNWVLDGIPFNNSSFSSPKGTASQCECVVYPHSSNIDSWILFLELKYSDKVKNNKKNLNEAKEQLFKTQYYYKSKGVFDRNNTCYLLASLPMQRPPFANFSLTEHYLSGMKKKHNVVIGFQNSVKIINDKVLIV